MNVELLKIAGASAGVIGVFTALVIIIFREIIRKRIFPRLTKNQAYKILLAIVLLSFGIGCFGIYAWFEKGSVVNQQTLRLTIYLDSVPWKLTSVEIPEINFTATTNAVGEVEIPAYRISKHDVRLLIGNQYTATENLRSREEKSIFLQSPRFKESEIAGIILRNGTPEEGVQIVTELGDSTRTDKSGQFRLKIRSGISQDKITLTYFKAGLSRRAVIQVNQMGLTLDL